MIKFQSTSNQRGAAAVEFALILPLLVLLMLGIIIFAQAFNAYISVTHAAREGARLAAVDKFDANKVEEAAYPLSFSGGLVVDGPDYPEGKEHGKPVIVTVRYPFRLNIPLWKDVTINLESQGVSRYE